MGEIKVHTDELSSLAKEFNHASNVLKSHVNRIDSYRSELMEDNYRVYI